MFFNRYFGAALAGFWFLTYEYLLAVLPTLRLKGFSALAVTWLVVGLTTYSLSRTEELAAMEETAFQKLQQKIADYFDHLRDELSRGASGVVVVCATAVSTMAKIASTLVFLGALSVFELVKQSIVSVFLTIADALQFFCTLLGLGADVVAETLQPVVNAVTRTYAAVRGPCVAAASMATHVGACLHINRTWLSILAVCLDLVLPYNFIGAANLHARAFVLENYSMSLLVLVVVLCVVVEKWKTPA